MLLLIRRYGPGLLAVAAVAAGLFAILKLDGWAETIGVSISIYLFAIAVELSSTLVGWVRGHRGFAVAAAVAVFAITQLVGVAIVFHLGLKSGLIAFWSGTPALLILWTALTMTKRPVSPSRA